MPNFNNLEAVPRKDLHVFFVLDTSGSMSGDRITALNNGMTECIDALSDLAKNNGDANIKIAVMQFDSNVKWITYNGPENMEDFTWEPLDCGGMTSMGAALAELDSKLSRNEFLSSVTGALMPVIIVMTDGFANDEWEAPLARIRDNKWFRKATKIGFAIGDDADLKMISEVVGNSEAVIRTTDLNLFKKLIKFVSVTASTLASTSHTTSTSADGASVIQTAKKQLALPDSITPDLDDSEYNKEDTSSDTSDGFDDGEW